MEQKKNAFWVILAFLTCPCHSVLVVGALAGTAGMSYITNNLILFIVILSLIFLLSLYMVFRNTKKNENRNAYNKRTEADDKASRVPR
jgi:mercuric ion transport protein